MNAASMNATSMAAEAITQNCHAIASRACDDLLNSHSDIAARFGNEAEEVWCDHLQQRLMELAAALTAGEFSMFSARLAWSRAAMQARGLTSTDLDHSLDALRAAVSSSLTGEAGGIALDYINKAAAAIDKGMTSHLDPFLDPGVPLDKLALQYVQAVVAGNVVNGMQVVIDAVRDDGNGVSVRDAILRVLMPAQREVGRLWHLNELSVSEEHLVSYTTLRLMGTLTNMAPRRPDNGLTAVAGAVAGNIHDIGIRAIAYLMEIEGWRVIYLGSDIPQEELPNTLDSFDADIMLLSVALSSQLDATARSISRIRANCTRPVKVLVGGNGLAEREGLWKEIGADGYATDADSALSEAMALATR